MKRLRLLAAAVAIAVMAVLPAAVSAGRGQTTPDENGCYINYSGLNRTGSVICVNPDPGTGERPTGGW